MEKLPKAEYSAIASSLRAKPRQAVFTSIRAKGRALPTSEWMSQEVDRRIIMSEHNILLGIKESDLHQ